MLETSSLRSLIRRALNEDMGPGDVTTSSVLTGEEKGSALAVAKAEMVVAGIEVFKEVFLALDPDIRFIRSTVDGQGAAPGEVLAEVSGNLANILMAERTALNLLQRMCGVATHTMRFAGEIRGTRARILDTRKTMPGLRMLDKYAVRVGGGSNHRMGLFDGVLIKDNHIAAAGGIAKAVARARQGAPHTLKIEVEAGNIQEVKEAAAAGADIIMLDNMDLEEMREAVRLIEGRALTEASGNVNLSNVKRIAETGVDFISVGAITHSAPAADISLNIR
ncbi:MAG TPA: carboxylating nicotinate-nucleotide diphosphorylase [Syntrophales bacterium]|nr:carboxylating nicotinate-nucleotide diphosphorylase [Syntrophales bacterium]